jgi:hypothetical protein
MKPLLVAPFALSIAALAACGGGSPSSANAPSTYAANTPELGVYNRLALARSTCGFPASTQNSALDLATQKHVDYQLLSNTINEYEDGLTFPAGFTGTYLNERLIAQGLSPTASALLGYQVFGAATPGITIGTQAASALLQDAGVLPTLLGGYGLQGIAVRHTSQLATWAPSSAQLPRTLANITFASTVTQPSTVISSTSSGSAATTTATAFASYPCGGESDAAASSHGKGQPIYLTIAPGRELDVSLTIKPVQADGTLGAAIPSSKKACTIIAPTSSSLAYLDTVSALPLACHQALFTPAMLRPNTRYEVVIAGFNRKTMLWPNASTDTAINRTFRFTTNALVLNP